MRSSDFPAAVEPRVSRASGGRAKEHHVAVIMPVGALGSALGAAPQSPGADLAAEVQQVKAAIEGVLAKLRQLPTINLPTFNQGVAMMEQGFSTIGMSLRGSGQ